MPAPAAGGGVGDAPASAAVVINGAGAEAPTRLNTSDRDRTNTFVRSHSYSHPPDATRRAPQLPSWGARSPVEDSDEDLRARLEVAERRLQIVENRLNEWRVAARQVLNVLALGPRSNEKYKREVADNLNRILTKLEQVQQVHYINCSFPAIEAQAPDFEMLNWDSLSSSSCGWHYIPFTLVIHVSKIKVNGRFKLSLAPDLSYAWVSFEKDMVVSMTITCEVTWGIVPLPLQAIIEAMVRKGFDDWLRSALIEPNRMRLSILADKLREERQLSDADVEKAMTAAQAARLRTPNPDDEPGWVSSLASMVSLSSSPAAGSGSSPSAAFSASARAATYQAQRLPSHSASYAEVAAASPPHSHSSHHHASASSWETPRPHSHTSHVNGVHEGARSSFPPSVDAATASTKARLEF